MRASPSPPNAIWIAAQVMEPGAELISLDAHFERVAGIAATVID